ncbi:hypothetical protein ABW20_dc0104081 [Dactylellina cionopaga]|nr:hypothetical protein ABW20_dc0104081 [Dactylellina cionopaga]
MGKAGVSVYDVRQKDDAANLEISSNIVAIEAFLTLPKVRQALGVESHNYHGDDNKNVFADFRDSGDFVRPMQRYMPALLAEIPALVYAGDADFICNWIGVKAWTEALEWPGKVEFNAVKLQPYIVNGKQAGEMKAARGLKFAKVANASHSAHDDQPEVVLDLIFKFMAEVGSGTISSNFTGTTTVMAPGTGPIITISPHM